MSIIDYEPEPLVAGVVCANFPRPRLRRDLRDMPYPLLGLAPAARGGPLPRYDTRPGGPVTGVYSRPPSPPWGDL